MFRSRQHTVEAEDVEQHGTDLVMGAVGVQQDGQQCPHRVLHLLTFYVSTDGKVLQTQKCTVRRNSNKQTQLEDFIRLDSVIKK